MPLPHSVELVQTRQTAPPIPQADVELPVRQIDPSQQPAQLVVSQVGTGAQVPEEQTGALAEQVVQACPPDPQAPAAVPIWQTPP